MTEVSKPGKGTGWTTRYPLKGWASYLIILVVVSLLHVSIRLVFMDSMVIYAKKDKPDFIQVFFPIDGAYSEENSVRSALFDNTQKGVKISLPLTSIDHVRIDPANEAAEVVITKIEWRHLFGSETYMPSDLLTHAKPLQMIDKLEVTPAGLLIRSTGNDPAFELQLNKHSGLSQFIILGIVSVILSLAVFLSIGKFAHLKLPTVSGRVYLLSIPLLTSLGVAALFYPGFMSYDTLHALRGARNGVTDSMWPPMVSYVWRAVDLVSSNPSAMHFSQVFLLLFSIFLSYSILLRKLVMQQYSYSSI
jgi:hypothetical protein